MLGVPSAPLGVLQLGAWAGEVPVDVEPLRVCFGATVESLNQETFVDSLNPLMLVVEVCCE